MDIVLLWIQGQSERGCSDMRAGAPIPGEGSATKIYCNLIKAMLILIMDLKLNKQVIYSDHMQIFTGSCTSNIFAFCLEIPILE